MLESWTALLETISAGALLAWAACLLVGCRMLSPDLAVAVGVSGIWIGWESFRKLGLPLGPTLYGTEIVPGLIGTTLLLLLALAVRTRYERWRDGIDESPAPRSLATRERGETTRHE